MTLAQLEEILGKPSKSGGIAKTIDAWDDKGIYSYREHEADTVDAIAVDFVASGSENRPENCFEGRCSIAGHELNAASGPEQLEKAGFEQSPIIKTGWGLGVGDFNVSAFTVVDELDKIEIHAAKK
jgi:hypothetical protein